MTGDRLAPEPITSPEAYAGALLVVSSVVAMVQEVLLSAGVERAFSASALMVMAIAGVGFAVLAVVGELRKHPK